MAKCTLFPICGGCQYRDMEEDDYRRQKQDKFAKIMQAIKQENLKIAVPVFIPEGTRRRAAMTFSYIKKHLCMGFNLSKSHDIADCHNCPLLSPKLNANIENVRQLLSEICAEPFPLKKGKKVLMQGLNKGDVLMCEAENGIDILLEFPYALTLTHRMIIAEKANLYSDVIRISWRSSPTAQAETILEKTPPFIINSGIRVYIAAGTFLQASAAGEKALIETVRKYLGQCTGKIADLFCGIGTFSYALAQNKNNRIYAADSSVALLKGFQNTINTNQIPNIQVEARNLFKYPLDEKELASYAAVVFDPPRAGASAQAEALAKAEKQPPVVISVSCNPHTFVNDANKLIEGGYTLKEVTMVDQFVYSMHTELVALFEKE